MMQYKIGDKVVTCSLRWPTFFPLVTAGVITGLTDSGNAYRVRSFRRRLLLGRAEVWLSKFDIEGTITETASDGTHIASKER
jgi:hypothetical protein